MSGSSGIGHFLIADVDSQIVSGRHGSFGKQESEKDALFWGQNRQFLAVLRVIALRKLFVFKEQKSAIWA